MITFLRFFIFILFLFPFRLAFAQMYPPPNQQQGGLSPPQQRAGGPWEQDVLLYTSQDGEHFQDAGTFEPYAGVPCVIKDAKGNLIAVFQWFPLEDQENFDHVAAKISTDNGNTWSKPKPIHIKNYPSDLIRAFDPTLVLLDDGKIRLYFSGNKKGEHGMPTSHAVATYSAISEDGIHYTFEEGIRFFVSGKPAVDPAVIKLKDTWHYYSPRGPEQGFYHATSKDGLNFKREADITSLGDGIGNVVTYQEGIRFYAGSRRGLWWSFSTDGFNWTVPTYTTIKGGDPGIVWVSQHKFFLMSVSGKKRSIPTLPFKVKM